MPTASSNRVALRYILEDTYGTVPAAGNPNDLRITGESLAFAIQTDSSKEIRSDRQVTDLVQVGASASGGVNFEMSYKEFDTLLQAAFMDTWDVYGTNGVGAPLALTIDSTAGTLTAGAAPTGVDLWTDIAVGQFILLRAPSDAADGAILRVASRTSTVITVAAATPIPGTGSRAAVAGCTIATSRLVNGATQRSFSIEKAMLDVGQFFMYRGMNASKLSMTFQSGSIVTGNFDFMGKDSLRDSVTGLPGSPIASATYDIVNAVTGVGNILENGSPLSGTFIKSLKLDLDNKLRGQDAIGILGMAGIAPGTLAVSGEMEVYLADGAMYDKFVNNTASSVIWTMKDAAGNGYAITLPKIKYSDAKVQAGGLDQDVMLSMPFTALMDATTSKTILLDRFGVAI
jgi:uncharacterized protein YceK